MENISHLKVDRWPGYWVKWPEKLSSNYL